MDENSTASHVDGALRLHPQVALWLARAFLLTVISIPTALVMWPGEGAGSLAKRSSEPVIASHAAPDHRDQAQISRYDFPIPDRKPKIRLAAYTQDTSLIPEALSGSIEAQSSQEVNDEGSDGGVALGEIQPDLQESMQDVRGSHVLRNRLWRQWVQSGVRTKHRYDHRKHAKQSYNRKKFARKYFRIKRGVARLGRGLRRVAYSVRRVVRRIF